jgi:molybdate transport system substrate-binding protein
MLALVALVGCGSAATTVTGASSSTTESTAATTTSTAATTTTAAAAATTTAVTCNVFAAASLTKVFPDVQTVFKQAHPQYANVEFVNNFQGTDTLVAQIKEGAPADVFASASLKYGKELVDAGLIEKPVNFCMNKLIVIVPAGNPGGIATLADLAVSGKKIAIGAESVPVGNYTRTVLEKMNAGLGSDFSSKVMSNVVTEASKVTAVVSSVTLGEVDAGFVYVTDATSAGDKVERIDIPNEYQSDPLPTYPIAVVKTNKSGDIAQEFIDFLLSAEGQDILQKYDFLPVP